MSITITAAQREILVEHAELCRTAPEGPFFGESRYEAVITAMRTGEPITDHDQLSRFLWRRIQLALENLNPDVDLPAWYTAVRLLEHLGEDISEVFTGRPTEDQIEFEHRFEALLAENPTPTNQEVLVAAGLR